MPLLIFGAVAWYDYLDEAQDARQATLRSAYSLAEHADTVFSAIEMALQQVDRSLDARQIADARGDGAFHQQLQALTRRLPPVESIFIVDETGTITASSRAFPMPPYDVQHREYFLAAKAGHEGLFVSVPFRGEFARSVAFTASRPLMQDGVFRGLVAVTVFPEYFHSLYRSAFMVEEGTEPTAVLLRRDGTVIFRSPDARGAEPIAASDDLISQAAAQNAGLLVGRGVIDARSDLTAFRTLPNVPLTFVYAVRQADMTADWFRRLAGYGLLMACVSGVIAGGGALVLFAPAPPLSPPPVEERPDPDGAGIQPRLRGATALLDAVRSSLGLARRKVDDGAVAAGLDERDLIDGATFGVAASQRLLSGGRGDRQDARIVNVGTSLRELRQLLMGSAWPPMGLDLVRPQDVLDVFVDPGSFDLALFDLAMGLLERAPAGARFAAQVGRRTVGEGSPEPVGPGDYVCIAFTISSNTEPDGEPRLHAEARLRLVERFAIASGGALVREDAGTPERATLWLPAALVTGDAGGA